MIYNLFIQLVYVRKCLESVLLFQIGNLNFQIVSNVSSPNLIKTIYLRKRMTDINCYYYPSNQRFQPTLWTLCSGELYK